jgi:Cu(I)/Ag(I) efflux system membrane protein CusA/SilA
VVASAQFLIDSESNLEAGFVRLAPDEEEPATGPGTIVVLGTLPVALAGGVWLLWALSFEISVAVLVGFIALAGVAVETGIVMLVYLNIAWTRRARAAAAAKAPLGERDIDAAVHEGALLRLRPKVMTVATIFAGLLPIMFGAGTGSQIMRRIAAPMVGGMITATALTLLVIPAVFVIWKRASLRRVIRQADARSRAGAKALTPEHGAPAE